MSRSDKVRRYLERSLVSLSSSFSQLVFLATLRDPYTGRYLHEGWATVAPDQEVDQELRQAHRRAFESVIRLSLVDLARELREHFKSMGQAEDKSAKLWLQIEPYREMAPEDCGSVERQFFISQVRAALEILARLPEWDLLDGPVSLPLRPPGLSPPLHRDT